MPNFNLISVLAVYEVVAGLLFPTHQEDYPIL